MPDADFHYAVTGRWPFPPDMLRYDDARPATDADLALVERLSGEVSPDGPDADAVQTVNLIMPEAGRRRPNAARWESFGWQVPGDEGRKAERAEAERVAALEANLRSGLAKLSPEEAEAIRWDAVRRLGL